jgi:hypothetical protein
MQRKFRSLIGALSRAAKAPPQNLLEAISALPPVGTLPSPWTTWLFVSLMAYRKRQQWGKDLLRKHLPEAIPPCRKFLEREQPVEMIVPGAPDWELELDCGYELGFLTHRVSGEVVMVNLAKENVEAIVYVHYLNHYVKPQSRWEPAGRLLELHPDFDTIWYAIGDLVQANVLCGVNDDREPCDPGIQPDAHHLGIYATSRATYVDVFFKGWQEPANRLWLAAVAGDWLLGYELALAVGDSQLIAVTKQRADECRKLRCNMVRRKLGNRPVNGNALDALHEMGAENLPDLIRQGLTGDDSAVGSVLWHLNKHDDPSWCPEVFKALDRLRPGDDDAGVSLSCARYLLKHGHRIDQVVKIISDMPDNTEEVALLLLEHAPQHALPAIRRALRATDSISNGVAASLAMIDRPWSRQELVDALEGEYRDAELALPLVVALEESHDPETRAVAEEWEQRLDPDMVEEHRRYLQWAMDRLRDRVVGLRCQTPV